MSTVVNYDISGGSNRSWAVTSYTSSELQALAAAGGLTPYATYVASDTGQLLIAQDAAKLVGANGFAQPAIYQAGFAQQIRAGLAVNSNANKQSCWFAKETAPGPFYAVRLVVRNHNTDALGLVVRNAVIAVTETADASDQATTGTKTYHPRVGGASVDTLDSSADAYGWRTVKWAGASGVTVAAATSATQPTVSRSDWVYLKSVPRIDADETLPLVMYRVGYNCTNNIAPYFGFANATVQSRSAANMGRICQSYFVTDAAGIYSTAPQTNSPSSSLNNTISTVGVEFMLASPAKSIWFIGDSTVQCGAVSGTDFMSSWGLQACALLTDTYGKPATHANYGFANQTAATYWDLNAKQYLTSHKPQIAVYQVIGHNDFSGCTTAALTRVAVQRCMGKAMEFIELCRENSIVPVLCTAFSTSAISTTAADAERLALNASILSMGIPVIDMAALLDDATVTPQRILTAYNSGDNIHPNLAGQAAQGALAARVLALVA